MSSPTTPAGKPPPRASDGIRAAAARQLHDHHDDSYLPIRLSAMCPIYKLPFVLTKGPALRLRSLATRQALMRRPEATAVDGTGRRLHHAQRLPEWTEQRRLPTGM